VALLSTAAFASQVPCEIAPTSCPNFYIITGSGGQFTATKYGTTVGEASQPIQTVIDAIKNDALLYGEDIITIDHTYIQFGDNDGVLDIGEESITFEFSGSSIGSSTRGNWNITLSGKITSSGDPNISVQGNPTIKVQQDVSINSTADITYTSSAAYPEYNCAICNMFSPRGTVNIIGGTVTSTTGTITLGGSPTISEDIKLEMWDTVYVITGEWAVVGALPIFAPGEKTYNITFLFPAGIPEHTDYSGRVVVVGGAAFVDNFTLTNHGWDLAVSEGDLVMVYAGTPIINPTPSSNFGIVQNGQSLQIVGTSQATPIRIYNLRGSMLMNRTAMPNENISVAHLPKGVYMVKAGGKTVRVVR